VTETFRVRERERERKDEYVSVLIYLYALGLVYTCNHAVYSGVIVVDGNLK
jgi:hypothetical protein